MTQEEFDRQHVLFYHVCIKFLRFIQKELNPIDGEYLVDYYTIKRVCGSKAEAVFTELLCSDIATDNGLMFKGLIIKQDGIDDALAYYTNKIN